MQLINIVPVANLSYIKDQPMGMFLTHLVEKNLEYREFAKNFKGYKILDNSLIELKGAVSLDRLCNAACLINADEIILPDVFLDGPATLNSVYKALEDLKALRDTHRHKQNLDFKVMAVAQGANGIEFCRCLSVLLHMGGIDVVGIPKVCAKLAQEGRPAFEPQWNIMDHDKQIHLLGIWYSFEELGRYDNLDAIRSLDTCLPAYFALYNLPASAVRADGFTLDLEHTNVPYGRYKKCQPIF